MKRLFSITSTKWRRLLCLAAWAVVFVLIFASTPFLFDLLGRGIGWMIGLFPHPGELWKEYPWCF